MTLNIAPGLSLPDDVVTQTMAILARRGAGKTYTAKVVAEEMIGAGLPIVALDPIGVWWGLRSSAEGKRAGLPVTILGGDHGDLPLEPGAGALVANLVADEPVAMVLDLSAFETKAAQARFVTDFAERLYRAKTSNKAPLHVFLDEADEFAPQRAMPGEQRMLGAFETLVRRGRARGIGCTMITQRPAALNKNVLTQVECLVVMQMTGPQDRAAIKDWVRGHADAVDLALVNDSLAGLKQGEAWWWSPAWLETLKLVKTRTAHTFDSSATPKPGETRPEAKVLAAVDLDRLKEGMDRVVQEVERNDPKRLQARIRELEREVAKKQPATVIETRVERVEVTPPWIEEVLLDTLQMTDRHIAVAQNLRNVIAELSKRLLAAEAAVPHSHKPKAPAPQPKREQPVRATWDVTENVVLGVSERKALTVLARYPEGLTKGRLASLSGYSARKSTIRNTLSKLRKGGFVYPGDPIVPTEAGLAIVADDLEVMPTGGELLEYWLSKVGAAEGRVLSALVGLYPQASTKEEVAAITGDDPTVSTMRNAISKLRALGLAEKSGWRATDDFMESIG